MQTTHTAIQFCEEALQRQKDYCLQHCIHPSWPALVDRLLERRSELAGAYTNIFNSVEERTTAADTFFDALLCAVSVWGTDSIKEMRDDRRRLKVVNAEISNIAHELSALLREREELQNRNSFGADTHYHVIDVVNEASRENYLFQSWVRDDLNAISARFDMKYWPSLAEFMDVISQDAENAEISVSEPVTEAALSSSRSSKADFCRALLERVEICKGRPGELLPHGFHLKDETWASLVNCVLDLEVEDLVDGAYMKRLRQRSREQS